MKNIIIFLLSFGVLSIFAQDNKFVKKEQADEAFANNLYFCYEPKFFDGHKKLGAGEDTISFSRYTLIKMAIVGGRFWVIQKPGTVFVVRDKKIIRRWDCGNEITGFDRLPQPEIKKEEAFIPLSMLSQLKITGPKGEKGNRGERGFPGKDGKDGESSSTWLLWTIAGVTTVVAILVAIFHSHNTTSNDFGGSTHGSNWGGTTH